jgi:cyclohexanone monooxygenase
MLIGPNTGLGHSSMIYMIESQVAYLLDALAVMDRHDLAIVDVRRDAQDSYNRQLQRRMRRTVWLTGCRSWYLDARGRNTAIWPGFSFAFRWITRRFDLAAYDSIAQEDLDAREDAWAGEGGS